MERYLKKIASSSSRGYEFSYQKGRNEVNLELNYEIRNTESGDFRESLTLKYDNVKRTVVRDNLKWIFERDRFIELWNNIPKDIQRKTYSRLDNLEIKEILISALKR